MGKHQITVDELIDYLDIKKDELTISDSLKRFAEDNGLPSSDVIMLSRINFRGRVPTDDSEWIMIYAVIKNVLGIKNVPQKTSDESSG